MMLMNALSVGEWRSVVVTMTNGRKKNPVQSSKSKKIFQLVKIVVIAINMNVTLMVWI